MDKKGGKNKILLQFTRSSLFINIYSTCNHFAIICYMVTVLFQGITWYLQLYQNLKTLGYSLLGSGVSSVRGLHESPNLFASIFCVLSICILWRRFYQLHLPCHDFLGLWGFGLWWSDCFFEKYGLSPG